MRDVAGPEDWVTCRLGHVAKAQYGTSAPATPNGSCRVVGMPHVSEGTVCLDRLPSIDLESSEIITLSLRKGDVLFNRTNSLAHVGKVGIVHANPVVPTVFASYLVRLHVDKRKADSRYVALCMLLEDSVRRIKLLATPGVSQFNINPTTLLRHFYLLLPPITVQRGICLILHHWDIAIARMAMLLKARRKLKRGLLQQLLTGRRRFPQFRKNSWRECRLRDVAEECNEPGRGTLGRDRIMGVTKSRGIVPMEDRLIGNVDRYQIVRKDWFAYNPMRLNIGSIARSRSKSPVLVSPDYVVFRCQEGELDPAFLDQYRRGHLWESYMRVCGAGSVRVRIYFDDLGRHKMHLPPIAEQRRIAEALETLDDEIELLRQLHDTLKEQKKGLMQMLLTGRVRVPQSILKAAETGNRE